jgi:fibronectin type 3 domain-containing protein
VPAVLDAQAPSVPGGLAATGSIGQVRLNWTAATDNVGVDHYDVFRSTTSGFTPGTGNRIAQPTTTSYTDTAVSAGDYYYRVSAVDAAGNSSTPSTEVKGTATADTTPPTVSLTAPAPGTTVSGTVTVTATANDDVAVSGVQFKLDGATLNAEDTTSPYSTSWDTTATPNGTHTLTAVARDGAAHTTTSTAVTVTVTNAPPDTSGLVAAYGFGETTGTAVTDSSSKGNTGTIAGGATRVTTGKYGAAISFDGVNDMVSVPDAASLDLTNAMTLEAWVNPTTVSGWRTAILKEQTGNLVYALYASATSGRPGAHVFTAAESEAVGTAALPVNTWTHIAATYDGAAVRLYVNGVQVSSTAVSGTLSAGSGPLRIGGNGLWSEWFKGTIDEVRVYSTVLTAAQIQADMAAPVAP